MTQMYHKPVLLEESVSGLNIQAGRTYVDVTFGGGGHSKKILDMLVGGRLIAFDQDDEALANSFNDERLILVKGNFRYLKNYLKYYQAYPCDGILADLGISSHQIDQAERGFSTRFDGPLDFRMNRDQDFSGKLLLNEYSDDQLKRVFFHYGEIKNAAALARMIVKYRKQTPLETIGQLRGLLESFAPRGAEYKYFARVFQAIRIEVNQEMEALEQFLAAVPDALKPGGRLSVIAYHSLEDRAVKNFIKAGNRHGQLQKDFYGNVQRPLQAVYRKVIKPTEKEIAENPRARSAKLRVAQKVEGHDEK